MMRAVEAVAGTGAEAEAHTVKQLGSAPLDVALNCELKVADTSKVNAIHHLANHGVMSAANSSTKAADAVAATASAPAPAPAPARAPALCQLFLLHVGILSTYFFSCFWDFMLMIAMTDAFAARAKNHKHFLCIFSLLLLDTVR